MIFEATNGEHVDLDEVSEELPEVFSRVVFLLLARDIQHHAIESVGLVLLDQELLKESIGFDATSELK